jgi:hypothetical protein
MKADEFADSAGKWGGRILTGLCFFYFWGLAIVKCISNHSDFGYRADWNLTMVDWFRL